MYSGSSYPPYDSRSAMEALEATQLHFGYWIQGVPFWRCISRAPLKGDIDVEVDVDKDGSFGCLKGVSKSVQVLQWQL